MSSKKEAEMKKVTAGIKFSAIPDPTAYDSHVHAFNTKKILEWYILPSDAIMNRGIFGWTYKLWVLTLIFFHAGVLVDALKYNYLFPLISIPIEAGLVFIFYGVLQYLNYRARCDIKTIVRATDLKNPVEFNVAARSMRARYNVAADCSLLGKALPFIAVEVFILVVLATGITDNKGVRIPYYDAVAPKTAAEISAIYQGTQNGLLFATQSEALRCILALLSVIKGLVLLGVTFDMESFLEKKQKLEKLYGRRDELGGKDIKTIDDAGDRRDYTASAKNDTLIGVDA